MHQIYDLAHLFASTDTDADADVADIWLCKQVQAENSVSKSMCIAALLAQQVLQDCSLG